ncbi:MAG: peptidoglycan DD-metalloendopeptidase family protein [Chloroflexota bacterium]
MRYGIIAVIVFLMTTPDVTPQTQRLQGANGWLLPVTGNVLSSDEAMHLRRGSVNAWDLTVPNGSRVWPMADGIVQYAGCNNAGGYGCWVLVDHADGYSSVYAHLMLGSIQVQRGQQITQGTVLGGVGWTGKTSFGPHLNFEIRHTSGRQRIDRYFNVGQMNKCDFCEATGRPANSVTVTGPHQQQHIAVQQPGLTLSADFIRLWILAGLIWAAIVTYVIGLNDGLLWFSFGNGSFLALIVVILTSGVWLPRLVPEMPIAAQETAQIAQSAPIQSTDAWQIAYAAMRHWEGSKCVHDPSRTFRGITQNTFDSWRRSQGQPTGDVCTISEQEAEQIYYQNYWVRSGANRMPRSIAITHFDFAVNAGVGRAAKAFSQCRTNVRCYNNYRENFYRSLNSFSLYGAGWLNRLASIRSLTEGKG